jgi:hypothetical protein
VAQKGNTMRTFVEIEWDYPEEIFWLNPENIQTALAAYCPNTKFKVSDIGQRLKAVHEMKQIQVQKGNYDQSEYMRGLTNGLILANNALTNSEEALFEPQGTLTK